jgi:lysophospholipase L1-like esterase
MGKIFRIIYLFVLAVNVSFSQDETNLKWWNPEQNTFPVIEGKHYSGNEIFIYNRLTENLKDKVRKPVWRLSKNSAGLSISFMSNSPNITVRYKVKGEHAFPHMPATGVSGVDLYAKNTDGKWLWNKGTCTFRDTITYTYKQLPITEGYHKKGREYKLYLPLYNEVEWLEIGVTQDAIFTPVPIRKEKPIVVYGTSIVQGACASRSGMAWTSILERNMDRQIINLGFSGNARLEHELINYIKEIDAKLYILDCLPNLVPATNITPEQAYHRIIESVKELRKKQPTTPILLTEHAGYSDGETNKTRKQIYKMLNDTLQGAFKQLKTDGVENIHLLTKDEIALGIDSYVDGTHPNDYGMIQYANAYEKRIRTILNESKGTISTTMPVTQFRPAKYYDWRLRHQHILESNKKHSPKICFIGNSIVHQWGGVPNAPFKTGVDSWDTYLRPLGVKNFGYGWDRIENVLWRIHHGELDGFDAEQVIMKIGTNNTHLNSDEEILEGLRLLVQEIKQRQPLAKITLVGILPRRDREARIHVLNQRINKLTEEEGVNYLSIGNALLNKEGKIDETLFRDGLHPNKEGYDKIAPLIHAYLINK